MRAICRHVPLSTLSKRLGALVRRYLRVTFVVSSCLGFGCRDFTPSGISSPPDVVSASVALDPSIDPADSWVATDVSVTGSVDVVSDEPYLDPATDATVTSSTETASLGDLHFQTGFAPGGAPVAVTHHTPEPDDPDSSAITVTRVVGDIATDYDAQGRIVPETPIDTLEGPSPLNELPVIQAQVMIDALVKPPEDGGGGGGDSCTDCEIAPQAPLTISGLRMAGAITRVVVRTARTLVLESEVAGTAGTTGGMSVLSANGHATVARRLRRGYSRRTDRWVLDSATIEGEEVVDGRTYRHRTQMRYRNVRFHLVPGRDAARRLALRQAFERAPTEQPAGPRTRMTRATTAPRSVVFLPSRDESALTEPCTDKIGQVGSSGPSVVFQHGFFSDPCTWGRMEPWVIGDFRFSTRIAMQTPSLKRYDEQALELRFKMAQTGGRDWVFIGHSNGGIVSRRAAQVESNSYDGLPIRGVLTIGSPHGGAPAMNVALPLVRGFFQAVAAPYKLRLCPHRKRGCSDMWAMTDGSSTIQRIYEFQRDHLGAASEMTTTSSFRQELERPAEPFVRASIVSHAYPKWQWKRMWGDMHCNPEDDCGGREAVKRTQRLEKHLKKMAVLNALGALGSLFSGNLYAAGTFAAGALRDASHLAVLHIAEWAYNKWVRGDPDSDGIVPAWSQIYPRTSGSQQFHIPNADSHVGSTKSDKVRSQVRLALRSPTLFNVPTR